MAVVETFLDHQAIKKAYENLPRSPFSGEHFFCRGSSVAYVLCSCYVIFPSNIFTETPKLARYVEEFRTSCHL